MRKLVTRRRWLAPATAVVAALLFSAPASAATFTVDRATDAAATGSTSDGACAAAGGGCTLRAAVQEANDTPGTDSVAIPAGSYATSITTAIELKSAITLVGAGARTTSVDAGGHSRVFRVTAGTATISGLTIEGGTGGVQVEGASTALTLDRVSVSGNTLQSSGASGGGVNLTDGSLTVRDSTISGNTADDTGGTRANGGGVNAAAAATGLTMDDVTIAGNRATSTAASTGGGLQNATAGTLRHVTFSGNATSGSGQGGNLFQSTSSGSVSIADSILAGGSAGTGPNCAGKTPVKQGHNLADDTSCALPAGSTVAGAALTPFGDHGGSTDTLTPSLGSLAVDAAAVCPASGHDQRGQTAPAGTACDLGAVELGADLSASLTPSALSVTPRGSLTYVMAVRNGGLDPSSATGTFMRPPTASLTFVNSASGACSGTSKITCDFGTLVPGAVASATITVTTPAAGSMTATARAAGSVPDPNPADDLAGVTTPVAVIPPGPDTTAPVLTGLLLVQPMHPHGGGRLRYTLSENATLTLRLDRRVPGHPHRLVRVGTQKLRGRAGAGTAKLAARWSGHKPKVGRYRITVTAVDAAGNAARPRSIAARVIQ